MKDQDPVGQRYALDPCTSGCRLAPVEDESDVEVERRCTLCGRRHRQRLRPGVLRVAFWNKWNLVGPDRLVDGLGRAVPGWDVMLLVECTESDVQRLSKVFGADQVCSVFDHDVDRTRSKPHGPAVVLRHGLEIVAHRLTFPWKEAGTEPKGDKSLTVEVEAPFGSCTFVAIHVMNGGDGDGGWDRKLRTYERLNEELDPDGQPWPVVVGMDGNVWEDQLDPESTPDQTCHAQKWFQAGFASHGLADTLRTAIAANPDRALRARERLERFDGLVGTYQQTATVTRFDRIYASPDIEILDAGVDVAGLASSDHAVAWADLLFPSTLRTEDPELTPRPRRPKRDLDIDDVVQAVLRSDRYGWNRRGYLARVALASVSDRKYADRDFINDHYPGDSSPHQQWNGARRSTNQSWQSLGAGRFGDELVHFDRTAGRHWMELEPARIVVDVLGIADLVDRVDSPDLEATLAERLNTEEEGER